MGSCLTDATRETAPGVPFANLPLRQSPNACASDRRGILDPVAPYKTSASGCLFGMVKFGPGAVNMAFIAAPRSGGCVTWAP